VYGTDASPSGIEIAKKKNPQRFFLQDLEKDDLPEELQNIGFDTIISTEVIEHLYSPRDYLDFCKKILLKHGGGDLIVSTPYHGYFKNVVMAVSGKMDKHFTVLWDGGHIKFWSRKTLTQVLEEKGFKDIKFTGCGRFPFLWKSMIVTSSI
jgi:2-polyprenyl-3-methyl-5-hydroxy-6-metoxy-1,4-benzoquinol methylase